MTTHKTILVVDDSRTIRNILSKGLSAAGYEVILAENGIEALGILEWAEKLPDLITLDIDMPRMNGFEVCEKIRADAARGVEHKEKIARIPIIFVSANDCPENRNRGYELGVIDFIAKPFPAGKVLETINAILHNDELFREMRALIVDDSSPIQNIVANILSRHKIETILTSSGEEALKTLRAQQYTIDLVVTDYLMPGINGAELCSRIRKIKEMQNVPIFFISSVRDEEAILKFFQAGANDYLPKPFLNEEFRARILTHLRNRRYIRDLESMNARLDFQANHDQLTSLYNRGFFVKQLEGQFKSAQLQQLELCCMIFDLDKFKQVNDSYGHATGDLVLKEFSRILTKNTPRNGITARYGGEEFVILLPETDLRQAEKIAENILKTTEQHIFSQSLSELRVTTSIGLASLREHVPESPDRLLIIADNCLYNAKGMGRNTCSTTPKKQ